MKAAGADERVFSQIFARRTGPSHPFDAGGRPLIRRESGAQVLGSGAGSGLCCTPRTRVRAGRSRTEAREERGRMTLARAIDELVGAGFAEHFGGGRARLGSFKAGPHL